MVNKQDREKEVNLANLYVGLKTDNLSVDGLALGISMSTFDVLEKMDYSIGEVGSDVQYTIYKDLNEERYSYVDSNGNVFIPKDKAPFPASNHLRSVSEMKSLVEILKVVIEKYKPYANEHENGKKALASYQRIVDGVEKAKNKGLKACTPVAQIIDNMEQWINFYILAFGNPLDRRDREESYYVEAAKQEEIAKEPDTIKYDNERVIDARDRFGDVGSGPKM